MTNIIESSNIPESEKVYLRKDFLGWRVVEPWKDPETGKINWFNFILGGKRGVVFLIVLLLLLGVGYLAFKEQVANFNTVMDNPCSYCKDCQEQARNLLNKYSGEKYKINISNLNITIKK